MAEKKTINIYLTADSMNMKSGDQEMNATIVPFGDTLTVEPERVKEPVKKVPVIKKPTKKKNRKKKK